LSSLVIVFSSFSLIPPLLFLYYAISLVFSGSGIESRSGSQDVGCCTLPGEGGGWMLDRLCIVVYKCPMVLGMMALTALVGTLFGIRYMTDEWMPGIMRIGQI
jgi:hypothetical protein